MTRWVATRRNVALVGVGAVAGLAALFARSWVPAMALVPVLGLVVLAVAEILLPLPVRARRTIEPPTLLKGDAATVRIATVRVPLPGNLVVVGGMPDGLHAAARTPFRPDAGGLVAAVPVTARRRGEWTFPDVAVSRTGALGLFERRRRLDAPARVTVLPVTARERSMRLAARHLASAGVPTRLQRRGPGDEFYALRDYLPGDAFADINWRATARADRIITNEFLPDEPPRYLVYVDARAVAAEEGIPDAFERTLELGAAIVDALFEARAHVGLVLLAYEGRFQVPGGGAAQAARLRRMLLECRPGRPAPVAALVDGVAVHVPARARAFLVTPDLYDPTLTDALQALRARHGHVALMAPGFPEPGEDGEGPVLLRAAGALLNADQAVVLAGSTQAVDVAVQWLPDEPLPVVFSRLGLGGRRR